MSKSLTCTRLLQNPLGQRAAAGEPGDMVRVTDGERTAYLSPREFDEASPAHLRWLLASTGHWSPSARRTSDSAARLMP